MQVDVVSTLRSFMPRPDPTGQATLIAGGRQTRARIASRRAGATSGAARPLVHLPHHYKAPDLLGPGLARDVRPALRDGRGEPRTDRGPTPGAAGTRAAEHATRSGRMLHFCFTARDRAGIAGLLRSRTQRDRSAAVRRRRRWRATARDAERDPATVRLVTVAMMRPGDKLDSYRFLAAALGLLADLDWRADVVGDGPARAEVEQAFAGSSRRIASHWRGALPPAAVAAALRAGRPVRLAGVRRSLRPGYLEAQAMGLPVVALDVAGVSSVLRSWRDRAARRSAAAGRLTPPPSGASDRRRRSDARLGEAAAAWVRRERTARARGRDSRPGADDRPLGPVAHASMPMMALAARRSTALDRAAAAGPHDRCLAPRR